MRSIVISDIHAKTLTAELVNLAAEKHKADNILILGDVTNFGPMSVAVDYISLLKRKVYAIPGNCDPRNFPQMISKVATDMHGRTATIDGIKIAGLGGSNPTIFDTPFEISEAEIFSSLDAICENVTILMVHAPAFGHLDKIPSGMMVGSESTKAIVDKYRPLVVLSGHVHEERGMKESNGTLFLNPGAAKEGFAALLVVENGKATAELLML
ncbi:MAG: metallophosphoesterase family protein [Methanomassiliicoccaceae archaeon]|jgi:Icc-related predicted phosphoesterase|nr:metallophosphoesterase family protein [Methanomassiliicoccaceae archaeon]